MGYKSLLMTKGVVGVCVCVCVCVHACVCVEVQVMEPAFESQRLTICCISCREAKLVVLDWDVKADSIVVSSLHYFEGDAGLRAGRTVFPLPPRVVADPQVPTHCRAHTHPVHPRHRPITSTQRGRKDRRKRRVWDSEG
jgi:hypothetical protein